MHLSCAKIKLKADLQKRTAAAAVAMRVNNTPLWRFTRESEKLIFTMSNPSRLMNLKTLNTLRQHLRIPMWVFLGGILAITFAEDNPDPAKAAASGPEARDELQRIREGVSQIREENAKLKEENAQLRKENQQLRRLLADKVEGNPVTPPATNSVTEVQTNQVGGARTNQATAEVESQLTHWFTTSSGKRHNSHCRYFKTTEGRLCGPDEGKACKLCGG